MPDKKEVRRTAKEEAERMGPRILEQCQERARAYGLPASVPLTVYASDADRKSVAPGEPWTAGMHREIMQEIATLLIANGFPAVLREIRPAEYFSWLDANGLGNTTTARAQFASFCE